MLTYSKPNELIPTWAPIWKLKGIFNVQGIYIMKCLNFCVCFIETIIEHDHDN